jgi:ATP-dependent DNA helicase RecG
MSTDESEIKPLLAKGESLTVEFKSDAKGLSDRDLVAAAVAMANTEGGLILLGVEDDGTVTGIQPAHQDAAGLVALIANRTSPSLSVRAEVIEWGKKNIVRIQTPKARSIVSTSEGQLLGRRLMVSGRSEAVPFYPHEFMQRQSTLGLIDPSATPLSSLSIEDLNPLERQRIREAIRRYGGDMTLLPLADEELDGALGLVTTVEGIRRPTVAGLLIMGREETLRHHIPAHEVAFQVLEGTEVRVNEFFRKPLLQTFEEIELLLKPV